MGYIRHDAIVVTSWKENHLAKARDKAAQLGLDVSPFFPSRINGYVTFLILPDGSKEGWKPSDAADEAREEWTAWVRGKGDNLYVDFAHVNYGGDEPERARLVSFNT